MTRSRKRRCLAFIIVCAAAAGWLWPHLAGVGAMALAYVGVLHLAVLAYEEIAFPQYSEAMSPEDYEHFCAALLREARWSARVTRLSGDQGVDVVAEKRGRRIVVQCKKYSKPVGNRAVQEIVAAIAHEAAERGIVVAAKGYTASAVQLAASNEVLLLHHSELTKIDRLLRRPLLSA
ncbi:MAG TPA: restriction endonuclease [Methylosinus sp.]|uniref:restriction endonuclease n=1 Tax=Methylosinus sp. TaxID=427 RepID=UPI002F928BCF